MTKRLTKEQWLRLIDEFDKREITQDEFVKEKGVKLPTFKYWLYKTRKEAQLQAIQAADVEFVEVIQNPSLRGESFRIRTETMTLEFDSLPPASWIAEIIQRSSARTFPC